MTNIEALNEKIAELEARAQAQDALLKSLLTSFLIRGTLLRAELQPLVETAKEMAGTVHNVRVCAALDAFAKELPGYEQSRMGPYQDDHDH